MYDILVKWLNPQTIFWQEAIKQEKETYERLEQEIQEEADRLFEKPLDIVKGITQTDIDEVLLAEYNNVPGWHRKSGE